MVKTVLTWGIFARLHLLPINTKFELPIWGLRRRKTNEKNPLKETPSSSFPRVGFSRTPSWPPLPLLLQRASLRGAPALAWVASEPRSLKDVSTPAWGAGCGPCPSGFPQLCPPFGTEHLLPNVSQLGPQQRPLPRVSCVPPGVASPLRPPLSELCLSWGAVGSPACPRTYFYGKTGVGAAEAVTETGGYLTECFRGACDFAATIIIIKVSFWPSSTTAFPRHKGE